MLINMLGFNIAWLGLIVFGNNFVAIALIMLILHFYKFSNLKNEVYFVLSVAVIGITIDIALHLLGFYIFNNDLIIPFWLVVLWACFACTLCHSLNFLSNSKLMQILIGGGLAPLSYISAVKLNAVDFGLSTITSYLILALIWAGLFVLFFVLKKHFINGEVKHV